MNLLKKYKVIVTIILSIIGVILAINLYVLSAPQFGKKASKHYLSNKSKESAFINGKFQNENPVPVLLPKSYGNMIKTARKNKSLRTPLIPIPAIKPEFSIHDSIHNISAIWLGHSTVFLQIGSITILTDPVFSKRASPISFIGPKPFEYTNPITPEELPLPDIIMISHDHFDHLDYKSIRKYYSKVSKFVVPLGIASLLEGWGIDSSQIVEFDWWQKESLLENKLQITAAPAQHFSGRRKQDYSTLWCSWVIEHGKQKIYFSGDSGYGDHFKKIGDTFKSFDLALMECGAYGTFWPHIHMTPEETVQASIDIGSKLTLPIHWGKYNLAFHKWTDPIERFTDSANKNAIKYTTPQIGQEFTLHTNIPKTEWWK